MNKASNICSIFFSLFFFYSINIFSQTASFSSADTICVNTPLTLTNTSVGATTYYWSFCSANINSNPVGNLLGNVGNQMAVPVFMDYANQNGNYYGFMVNNSPGGLIRFDFGNSLLNTPVATNLGNFGGIIPNAAQGIQIVQSNNSWYAIITGGDPLAGTASRILKVDFGANLTNPTPTATNWGNIGNLSYPTDIYVFKNSSNWFGLTVNYASNTITQFNFGTDFVNPPSGINLGNLGNLASPSGICPINDNGTWRVFVANFGSNTLSRIDFGNSLSNTPTAAINLGNIGGLLNTPRDLCILNYCNQIVGFIANDASGDIVRLNFSALSAPPIATSLGVLGGSSNPHSISQLFRVGDDLFTFLPNSYTNTVSRIKFSGCNNSSIPNSNLSSPPTITYNTSGTYNISLTINEGFATQSTFCKQVVVLQKPSLDFSFVQDVCNPLTVQFKNESISTSSYSWDFGNGSFSTVTNPTVTYSSYNNYPVKLKTSGCADSITKQLPITVNLDSVIINRDTVLCNNSSLQLNSLPCLSYCWSPTTGLSNSNIPNPIASPTTTTTYILNSQKTTNSLVINGDFSKGNASFASNYNYTSSNITEGQYFVGTNPKNWNSAMATCNDHTGGSGNMLLVNGAPVADINVWQQTITVKTNTNYAFSAWLQAIYPVNPAQLQFSINGKTIGNLFSAVLPTCNWQQFYTVWNSGSNTSATISIINKNIIVQGNDFALDDISFAELSIKRDSVTITVVAPPIVVASKNTSICEGKSVKLSAAGTTFYQWNSSASLSDSTIANPIASPTVTTNFIVKGYDVEGCFSLDTVKVNVAPLPTLSLAKNVGFCKGDSVVLNAVSNATSIQWFPTTHLSSGSIYNPIAKPLDTTKYYINLNSGNGCDRKDSITVNVWPLPTVKTIADTNLCLGKSVFLNTTTNASTIAWSPSAGLSNASIASPVANPLSSTQYVIKASSFNGCMTKDTVAITVLPIPIISKSADVLICIGSSKILFANASSALVYSWLPATGLNNAAIANPIASPITTTNYKVTVTSINGCTQSDSILVAVKSYPVFAVAPNNTSICANDSVLLSASGADHYQWLPNTNVYSPISAITYVKPNTSIKYQVVLKDTLCAFADTLAVSIKVNPLPTVALSKSGDANCSIGNVKLAATGAIRYRWFPEETLSNATTSNPMASPINTTFYHVKAFSYEGCMTEDSIEVKVLKNYTNESFPIPSAFSPNNDGKNDCFNVKYWGYVTDFHLTIYNRFGEITFSSNNINSCWNGKINGVEQPAGTYVYEIAAKTICGDVYRKGTVVLIR